MTQSNITTVDDAEGSPDVLDGFRIHDAQTANWVVRKIAEARQYADRVRAWAAAEIRRAERDEQFLLARFGRDLEEWCRDRLADTGGRSRSVNLPAGRIGFRKSRMALEVQDSAALLGWCRLHLPGAIMVTERVVRGSIEEHLATTGELPIGTVLHLASDRFYVGQGRHRDQSGDDDPLSF